MWARLNTSELDSIGQAPNSTQSRKLKEGKIINRLPIFKGPQVLGKSRSEMKTKLITMYAIKTD